MQSKVGKRGGQLGNRNAAGHGAPKRNRNALGHRASTPSGNVNAVKHGLYSHRVLTEGDRELLVAGIDITLLEILRQCICLQVAAIIRSQKIMYVRSPEDHTRVLVMESSGDKSHRAVYEIQLAWEKHTTFLEAQSTAMNSIRLMIKLYDELRHKSNDLIELDRQLRIERIRASINRSQMDEDHGDDDFIKAVIEGGKAYEQ